MHTHSPTTRTCCAPHAVVGRGLIGIPVAILIVLLVRGMAWSGECETSIGTAPALVPAAALVAPGLTLVIAAHEAHLEATVCLGRGILEYLVCRPGTFEHESLFTTVCTPSNLHTALLVIGCDALPFSGEDAWADAVSPHPTSHLRVDVSYDNHGTQERRPLSDFLVNHERADGAVSDCWIFRGSLFVRQNGTEFYAADRTGAVIGLTPQGAAVIQCGQALGNAYRGDDQGLEIADRADRPHLTPGTRVHLIIASAPPAPAFPITQAPIQGHP